MNLATQHKSSGAALKARLPALSRSLMITACFLTGLGLLAIYASSALKGAEQFHDPYFFIKKQSIVAAVGVLLMIGLQYIPLHWMERLTLPLLGVSLLCLALIYAPGIYRRVGGAARWMVVAGLRFQPSELAKVALIFFLAKNLSRPAADVNRLLRGLLPNILLLGVFAALLMQQPDFGSTALLFMVSFLMIYVAGASYRLIGVFALLIGTGAAAAIIAAPYRLRRVLSFLNPWADLQNGGFQIIQSYLGFQNGGFWGVGLGQSRQKLFFLPEAHTDFIFSVIGEELGVLGSLLICSLFLYLIVLGYRIAFLGARRYHRFLAFGLTSLIACQAAFNLGVVMGLLPTKGIPLPFISSGASSLLIFLGVTGVIARIGQEEVFHQHEPNNSEPATQ